MKLRAYISSMKPTRQSTGTGKSCL
jgi:hypothetical protein